jgi:hypothetical protein
MGIKTFKYRLQMWGVEFATMKYTINAFANTLFYICTGIFALMIAFKLTDNWVFKSVAILLCLSIIAGILTPQVK